MVGLIFDDDETACREEVGDLVEWCQYNNLSFNVNNTKELIVGSRKWRDKHTVIQINSAVVECVESFKFFSVHITKDLSWSKQTNTVAKRAQQSSYPSGS